MSFSWSADSRACAVCLLFLSEGCDSPMASLSEMMLEDAGEAPRLRDGTAMEEVSAGDADGVRNCNVEAEEGSGGRERRDAGEAAETAAGSRWLVYCGDIAGGRVHRKGDGGGCGKDGDAADTGECTTGGLRDVCPTLAPSRR